MVEDEIESGLVGGVGRIGRDAKRNKARFLLKERLIESTLENQIDTLRLTDDKIHQLQLFLRAIEKGHSSTFSLKTSYKHGNLFYQQVAVEFLDKERLESMCLSRFGSQHAKNVMDYYYFCAKRITNLGCEYRNDANSPIDGSDRTTSLIEYASLMGEYDIIRAILTNSGSSNAFLSISFLLQFNNRNDLVYKVERQIPNLDNLRKRVLQKFFVEPIPSTLFAYLIKSICWMRIDGFRRYFEKRELSCSSCQMIFNKNSNIHEFGSCLHSFCAKCLWEGILKAIDQVNLSENVLQCPLCNVSQNCAHACECPRDYCDDSRTGDKNTTCVNYSLPSETRDTNNLFCSAPLRYKEKSLEKFLSLPATIIDLKNKPIKATKSKKNCIHNNWHSALLGTVGKSRDVRTEKFRRYVHSNALNHVTVCLQEGVDIDCKDVYGHTALHDAVWRGYVHLVKILLGWGANPRNLANGHASIFNLATSRYIMLNGSHDRSNNNLLESYHRSLSDTNEILRVLKRSLATKCKDADDIYSYASMQERLDLYSLNSRNNNISIRENRPSLTTLIDAGSDHPGAGAIMMDNIMSEESLCFLHDLWRSIPTFEEEGNKHTIGNEDISGKKNKKSKKNSATCSARSYFCDAEGCVGKILSDGVNNGINFSNHVEDKIGKSLGQPCFFPYMRFLNYETPGGSLAPHVDLTKVCSLVNEKYFLLGNKEKARRSTHTFILYLNDCKVGGETILIRSLSSLSSVLSFNDNDSVSSSEIMAVVAPRRGRLLLFPHLCPHMGNVTVDVPKILLRGEVLFDKGLK
mmetsp:Transcript_14193/g.20269  ORF Transcript_14193/g.20269 Transcript_14193/m.20269 type:complete len:802 (+) Transcript_14193:178-2583(+)